MVRLPPESTGTVTLLPLPTLFRSVVLPLLKLPDGTVRVLVESKPRARLDGIGQADGPMVADVTAVEEIAAEGPEAAALMRSVADQCENYAKHNKKQPAEPPVHMCEQADEGPLANADPHNPHQKEAHTPRSDSV